MRIIKVITAGVAGLAFTLVPLASAGAAPSACTFVNHNSVMKLQANCTTTQTISIPQGFTLDGQSHTITAVDPSSGHFIGPVVTNAGTVANVDSLKINAGNLTIVCDSGSSRLRGILFDGASGKITNNTILAVNQGQSGCQEGNGIEARYFTPTGGDITSGPRLQVVINNNKVTNYQKTGIVANGYINANISDNTVGQGSVSNTLIAANSIQLGFNASGTIVDNNFSGNQWCGNTGDDSSTGLLLYQANTATIKGNTVSGNSDVGMYLDYTGNVQVKSNEVKDLGTDCNQYGHDIGIGNYPETGGTSTFTNNDVRGFNTPYDGTINGKHNTVSQVH